MIPDNHYFIYPTKFCLFHADHFFVPAKRFMCPLTILFSRLTALCSQLTILFSQPTALLSLPTAFICNLNFTILSFLINFTGIFKSNPKTICFYKIRKLETIFAIIYILCIKKLAVERLN